LFLLRFAFVVEKQQKGLDWIWIDENDHYLLLFLIDFVCLFLFLILQTLFLSSKVDLNPRGLSYYVAVIDLNLPATKNDRSKDDNVPGTTTGCSVPADDRSVPSQSKKKERS